MSDFVSLAERCERGSGPDRELDAAIMACFYTLDERFIGARWEDTNEPCLDTVWVDPATDKWVSTAAHEFTASLDASVALLERVLPLSSYVLNTLLTPSAHVSAYENGQRIGGSGAARTAARALLAAILRALAAKETNRG